MRPTLNIEDAAAQLESWLDALGIDSPAPEALSDAVRYLLAVLDENERTNVTAIRDPGRALRLHVLDSLTALPAVRSAPSGQVLDIGSGGGFPGVPIALSESRDTTVLDSVGRKIAVVDAALRHSRLSCEPTIRPLAARSEELARREPSSFQVVLSRAVADMPAILELSRPLVCDDGLVVVMKGDTSPDEVSRGLRAASILGLETLNTSSFALPVGGEARSIITFRVVGTPSIDLPRAEGRATKKPLA